MNTDTIETFLAVAACGNITEAANQLYIGQGTASARIQQLEEELGVTLLSRQRGVKTVQVTPEGEAFLTLAKQWASLELQAHAIKDLRAFRELRIGAVDTINTFTFAGVYPQFSRRYPHYKLFLQTEHSTEIHHLIEEQSLDLGFAFTLHESRSVISRPLYQEDMVVLCRDDSTFARTGNLDDLDDAHEIQSTVSPEFSVWHKRTFSGFTTRYVTVGTVSMLPEFLNEPENWTIITHSVASLFAERDRHLLVVPFRRDPPPKRVDYLLFSKYQQPWIREMSDAFLEEVCAMVSAHPTLELL